MKIIKIQLIIVFLLVQSLFVIAQSTKELLLTDNKLKSQTDLAVHKAAETFMTDRRTIGLSIGIYKHGKIYTYNYGETKKSSKKLVTNKTIYEIASITKTFAGFLLAQAVVEKKLNLNDDIRQYLNGDYSNLEFEEQPIKIVHLANHTSGLPGFLPDKPELFENADYNELPFILTSIYKNYTTTDFYEDLHKIKLDKTPGVNFKYSNSGAILLGFILEQVFRKSFEELVAERITNPLSMKDTKITLSESQKARLATGYGGNGKVMPYLFKQSQAAGGLHSTVSDLLKYVRFQFDERNEAIKLSHQVSFGNLNETATGLFWSMNKTPNGKRDIWHSGGSFGFSNFCLISLDSDSAVVLLSNEADPEKQNQIGKLAVEIKKAIN